MNICIVSTTTDQQAILVEQAVLHKGATITPWYWADFPTISSLSAEFDQQCALNLPEFGSTTEPLSIWIHGGMHPVAPEWLHQADVDFVKNESSEFLNGLLYCLASHAFCVNPLPAARNYRHKINQLNLAQKCGMSIPASLISNDVQRIREFVVHHKNHVIIKHATQMFWESENNCLYVPYTTRLLPNQVDNDLQLRSCPSIYQEEIDKSFELRIVFIGFNVFAAKIDSQHHGDIIDWRNNFGKFPPCEAYELPEEINRKILRFIRMSGLRHGSIDAIIDKTGQFVFIEINESGQFLWVEDLISEFPLLDCFSEYLIRQDPHFIYSAGSEKIALRDFLPCISDTSILKRIAGHIVAPDKAKLIE